MKKLNFTPEEKRFAHEAAPHAHAPRITDFWTQFRKALKEQEVGQKEPLVTERKTRDH